MRRLGRRARAARDDRGERAAGGRRRCAAPVHPRRRGSLRRPAPIARSRGARAATPSRRASLSLSLSLSLCLARSLARARTYPERALVASPPRPQAHRPERLRRIRRHRARERRRGLGHGRVRREEGGGWGAASPRARARPPLARARCGPAAPRSGRRWHRGDRRNFARARARGRTRTHKKTHVPRQGNVFPAKRSPSARRFPRTRSFDRSTHPKAPRKKIVRVARQADVRPATIGSIARGFARAARRFWRIIHGDSPARAVAATRAPAGRRARSNLAGWDWVRTHTLSRI